MRWQLNPRPFAWESARQVAAVTTGSVTPCFVPAQRIAMKVSYVAGLIALVTAGGVLVWTLAGPDKGKPAAPTATPSVQRDPQPRRAIPTAARAVAVPKGAPKVALDCAAPQGDAATFEGGSVAAASLCSELQAIGGMTGKVDTPPMRALARQTLDALTDDRLVAMALARAHSAVSAADVDAALRQGQAIGAGGEAAPREVVTQRAQQMRRETKLRLELALVVAHRISTQATQAEVEQEYTAHPDRYSTGGAAELQGYLARVGPRDKAAQQARAQKAAADFAAAVATLPVDVAVPAGTLTPMPPFVLDKPDQEPALAAAVAPKGAGQWTPAVRTKAGWMVAKIVRRTPFLLQPFEQVKAEIRVQLHETRRLSAQTGMLAVLRQEAKIVVLIDL